MLQSMKPSKLSSLVMALMAISYLAISYAESEGETNIHGKKVAVANIAAADDDVTGPQLDFYDTISGEPLDFNDGMGPDSPAVKKFKVTGHNPYNTNADVIKEGHSLFLTSCSGCHGHLAEGKLGPALHDDYWTYPKNKTDKGLFETIYGGASGQMGPQKDRMSQDDILKIMSWVRSIYDGNPKHAKWLKK